MSMEAEPRFSADVDTPEMLRYLLEERFSGNVVVTASLMASSIVVLKMVSEIDNTTPVIFCRRPPFFDESTEYRDKIVDLLGLENVSMNEGHETQIRPGDKDHCEYMWIQHRVPGRSFEMLHLNDSLAPYGCWISAVYHDTRPDRAQNLIEEEGRLTRVNPLLHWSKDDVREFMRINNLPYHKMAKKKYSHTETKEDVESPSYHY